MKSVKLHYKPKTQHPNQYSCGVVAIHNTFKHLGLDPEPFNIIKKKVKFNKYALGTSVFDIQSYFLKVRLNSDLYLCPPISVIKKLLHETAVIVRLTNKKHIGHIVNVLKIDQKYVYVSNSGKKGRYNPIHRMTLKNFKSQYTYVISTSF